MAPAVTDTMPLLFPARVDKLLNTIDALVVVLDPKGRIVLFNRKCELLSGYLQDEVVGRRVWEVLVPADEVAGVEGVFSALMSTGADLNHESDWLDRTGARHRIAWRNTCWKDDHGAITHVVATGVELSPLLRSEALRFAESESFRRLLGQLTEGVILLRGGEAAFANERAAEILGVDLDSILPTPLADLIGPSCGRALEAIAAGEHTLRHTVEVPWPDGSLRHLDISYGAVEFDSAPAVAAMLSDVTEHLRAIEDLRESEEQYRWLSAATIEGITHHDNGVITHVNARCGEIFGYEPGEMIGRSVLDFATKESGVIILQRIQQQVEGPYEVVGLRKDGSTFPLEIVTQETTQGGRRLRIAGLRDISTRKRLEAERQRAEDELHRAQRLESTGLLAGGIAHDFNNLLSVMLGAVELALTKVDESAPIRRELGQIRDAAEIAGTLTRQLLVFGGRDQIAPVVLDANEAIGRLGDLLQRIVREHVDFSLDLAPHPLHVRIPEAHLEQVMVNLALNAADALPDGGHFSVSTRLLAAGAGGADLIEDPEGAGIAVIEIVDDGSGMTSEVAARALEPFFTTKAVGRGTGLGLSVVYRIIRDAGGVLELETSPRKGTHWRILLPLTHKQTSTVDTATPAPSPVPGRVLVVEDQDDVRDLLQAALEHGGFTVVTRGSPEAAIELFERGDTAFDLLLTDVIMPGHTGPELAVRLREVMPSLKVMFISGYSGPMLARKGVDSAMLIQKPFHIDELIARVQEAIERRGQEPRR